MHLREKSEHYRAIIEHVVTDMIDDSKDIEAAMQDFDDWVKELIGAQMSWDHAGRPHLLMPGDLIVIVTDENFGFADGEFAIVDWFDSDNDIYVYHPDNKDSTTWVHANQPHKDGFGEYDHRVYRTWRMPTEAEQEEYDKTRT